MQNTTRPATTAETHAMARRVTGRRRKAWSHEHELAEARYLEAYGTLLREISDDELAGLIAQIERDLGQPIPETETIQ